MCLAKFSTIADVNTWWLMDINKSQLDKDYNLIIWMHNNINANLTLKAGILNVPLL